MRSRRLQRSLMVAAMLMLPVLVHAQEAALSGTVTDTTGGALPGVTVRAVHDASGNSFEAVTDARGDFRLAVRVGAYRLTAELSGFAPITRTVTLLVGQQGVVNLQMSVSGVQESVTVTGEAPLLDTTQSSLGGNIDPRQLQELPVNGRNWLDLVLMAPGARGNALSIYQNPVDTDPGGKIVGNFQLNVDGQQVTFGIFAGQPRYSRDAIAEFELLTSRFDATQGRSTGVQVNAVTKSGTNTPSGSFSSYFRDDRFNAADFVAKKVLPYQDQQLSGTFGGPIRKDKLHVFANYEYEREPRSAVWNTPYAQFNIVRQDVHREKTGGLRLDAQFSPRTRLSVRWTGYSTRTPSTGSSTSSPSDWRFGATLGQQFFGTLTQVLSNRAVNELKVGTSYARQTSTSFVKNRNARFDGLSGPIIQLKGFTAGAWPFSGERFAQTTHSVRDDFTYSFTKGGHHTVKLGAEYLYQTVNDRRCVSCEGTLDAAGGSIPADFGSLFPDPLDATTWNLAPLSQISNKWTQVFAASLAGFASAIPRPTPGAWLQDDWAISPRLTLNLGLRYDVQFNAFANDTVLLPFWSGHQPNDTNNVAPRVGFTFSLDQRTVLRGGWGLYYGTVLNPHYMKYAASTIVVTIPNDGRPDFASNPYNGPPPTWEQILAKVCTPSLVPGCIRREIAATSGGGATYAPDFTMPYAHQASVGLQRQLGTTMAIEADYIYVGERDYPREVPFNLSYNPATGVNYSFSGDIGKRPYPDWGFLTMSFNGARSNYHGLQTAFTKRFSNGWQASGTYTLSGLRDAAPAPRSGLDVVAFPLAPDLTNEYSLSVGDQRHRAVVNSVWELGYGFQLSGLYFFGSGQRYQTRWGADVRQIGTNAAEFAEQRLRPDGTIIPRNNFVGKPIHRVDLRLLRRFPLGGRAGIDGILEVFDVFNHANYGAYGTSESSPTTYGKPAQPRQVIAYSPRMLQLGFRFAF